MMDDIVNEGIADVARSPLPNVVMDKGRDEHAAPSALQGTRNATWTLPPGPSSVRPTWRSPWRYAMRAAASQWEFGTSDRLAVLK